MKLNIVLVEPQIPQNTGNVARTCAATNSVLHLVKPFGFSITDKHLKRAGLDYWYLLDIIYYDNIDHFFDLNKNGEFFYVTTKGSQWYTDVAYNNNSFLLFGKETAGLGENLLSKNKDRCIRIPMINQSRSLNLANAVAVVAYESLRQNNFDGLK